MPATVSCGERPLSCYFFPTQLQLLTPPFYSCDARRRAPSVIYFCISSYHITVFGFSVFTTTLFTGAVVNMFARLCRGIGNGCGSVQSLRRNQNITSQWSAFSTDVTMTGRLLQLNDLGNISEATKKVRALIDNCWSCINLQP